MTTNNIFLNEFLNNINNNLIKKRLNSDPNYIRPNKTINDSVQTNEKMKQFLRNYILVDNIDDVSLNTHIRYVTLDHNLKSVFRIGGLLSKKLPKYIVLENKGITWTVKRYHTLGDNNEQFESIFWKKQSNEDILNDIIERQKKELCKLRKIIEKAGIKINDEDEDDESNYSETSSYTDTSSYSESASYTDTSTYTDTDTSSYMENDC